MGRRTPAGSVSALRAPQGQSRKKMITSPLLIKNSQNKQISYGNGEHRPGLTPPCGLHRDISRVFGKIEQACFISKEVYVCCSKIVDSVFPAKGRCAQSVSIKKQVFYYLFLLMRNR